MATAILPEARGFTVEQATQRLAAVTQMCAEIATTINCVRKVLANEGEGELHFVLYDALSKAGWMADRATEIAGHGPVAVGDCDAWMCSPAAKTALANVAEGVSHGPAETHHG